MQKNHSKKWHRMPFWWIADSDECVSNFWTTYLSTSMLQYWNGLCKYTLHQAVQQHCFSQKMDYHKKLYQTVPLTGAAFCQSYTFQMHGWLPLTPWNMGFLRIIHSLFSSSGKRGSSCSTTAEHKPHNAMSKKKLVKQHFSKNIKSRNRTNSPLKVNLQLDRLEHS